MPKKFFNTPAIILDTKRLGEYDLLVEAFTPEHGLLCIKAKSARKPKAKLRFINSLFSTLHLELVSGKKFPTLKGLKIIKDRSEIAHDLNCFRTSSAIAEIIKRTTKHEDPHPEIFDILGETFDTLKCNQNSEIIFSASSLKILSSLGFLSRLNQCTICGKKIDIKHIHITKDGLACSDCENEIHLTADIARILHFGQSQKLEELSRLKISPEQSSLAWQQSLYWTENILERSLLAFS